MARKRTRSLRKMAEKVRAQGRSDDTILAHINRREARLLDRVTDGGTINPKTGMLEFWDAGGGVGAGADAFGGGDDPGDPSGGGGGSQGPDNPNQFGGNPDRGLSMPSGYTHTPFSPPPPGSIPATPIGPDNINWGLDLGFDMSPGPPPDDGSGNPPSADEPQSREVSFMEEVSRVGWVEAVMANIFGAVTPGVTDIGTVPVGNSKGVPVSHTTTFGFGKALGNIVGMAVPAPGASFAFGLAGREFDKAFGTTAPISEAVAEGPAAQPGSTPKDSGPQSPGQMQGPGGPVELAGEPRSNPLGYDAPVGPISPSTEVTGRGMISNRPPVADQETYDQFVYAFNPATGRIEKVAA